MIKNSFSLNEFLNQKDKTILNKKDNIFKAIIAAYSSNQVDKKEESSDEEEVKQVKNNTALRAIKTVKDRKSVV